MCGFCLGLANVMQSCDNVMAFVSTHVVLHFYELFVALPWESRKSQCSHPTSHDWHEEKRLLTVCRTTRGCSITKILVAVDKLPLRAENHQPAPFTSGVYSSCSVLDPSHALTVAQLQQMIYMTARDESIGRGQSSVSLCHKITERKTCEEAKKMLS